LILQRADNKVKIIDTQNVITRIIGIDFNSLYPSSYSSKYHPFNPYTNGIMYMPGRVKQVVKNQEEALKIINERNEIFSIEVKGHVSSVVGRNHQEFDFSAKNR
jgi:hypothetical protein